MNRYCVAPEAREDLKKIAQYIASIKQSPQAAKRLRSQFLQNFRRLARYPHLGQACPEFGESLRVWSVGNYAVFYIPSETGVEILKVVHGAQDFPTTVKIEPKVD